MPTCMSKPSLLDKDNSPHQLHQSIKTSKIQAGDECWPLSDECRCHVFMFLFEEANTNNLEAHIACKHSNAATGPAMPFPFYNTLD